MFPDFNLNRLVVMLVPLLLAVTVHEVAHGYAAYRLGDQTARLAGRLTLNPIKHLDLTGSLIVPLMLIIMGSPVIFGWAKPVPVNFNNLRNHPKDRLLVSAAGILANLMLVLATGLLFQGLHRSMALWRETFFSPILLDLLNMLGFSVLINTVLAVFNLIPIPPLDGSRILAEFLPASIRPHFARFERVGLLLLILLLFLGGKSLARVISFITDLILK